MVDNYYRYARTEILELVPADSRRILDVGCAAGAFGRLVKEKNNAEVWGIELNEEAAGEAARVLDKVLNGSIDEALPGLPDNSFDLIVFNDILEHLVEPERCLQALKAKLAAGGRFLCSIPNARFYKHVRSYLIHGDWDYVDEGILDRTHLRFFTYKSIVKMFERLDCELLFIRGINPKKRFWLGALNILLFGAIRDMRYMQFACLARPR